MCVCTPTCYWTQGVCHLGCLRTRTSTRGGNGDRGLTAKAYWEQEQDQEQKWEQEREREQEQEQEREVVMEIEDSQPKLCIIKGTLSHCLYMLFG